MIWMKSQSLSHAIVCHEPKAYASRKTHIYSYIEMDEFTNVYLTQLCVMSQRPSASRKTHIYSYIEMDEMTICVLSQRPPMVLGR
jgi:hypothetical protein